jgi:hypothetical protein
LLKAALLFLVLLLAAFTPQQNYSFDRGPPAIINPTLRNSTSYVLGAWNAITIDAAYVYSRRGSQPNPDCTRLGPNQTEVECFSIQQNFWIFNSRGKMVFWAQNAVQLAELKKGLFFGTYAFVVWSAMDPLQPLYCDPWSVSETICRAPIYTDPVRLPRSFAFFADISNAGPNYTLRVSNDFASRSWVIPESAGCPCFIETFRQEPPPWGYFPFEFVVVGLDSSATAFFGAGTSGKFSPGIVYSSDGEWHQVTLNTLHCHIAIDCITPSSTGENSMNLRWDSKNASFYWSKGANDQGVYIEGVSSERAEPPTVPHPTVESYLYLSMGSRDLAVATIFDAQGRATGYNASSGTFVQDIPHSFITLSGELGVVILSPSGSYRVVLTPVGSGPYHLFISKDFNVNGTRFSRLLDGTIKAWEPKQFILQSDQMTIESESNYQPLLIMVSLGFAWVTLIVVILLWLRKRHSSK